MIIKRCALLLVAFAVFCQAVDHHAGEALYAAIRAQDVVKLELLLKQSESVNLADDHGLTPLMYAAEAGSFDTMKLLVDRGANVNARNQFGSTALMWSATDLRKVRLLIERGADVNAVSKQGRTVLLLAAMSDHSAPTLRLLMAKGVNLRAVDGSKETALTDATAANDTESVRLLVEAGLDVNAADIAGFTPLMNAASNDNVETVKLLLSKGANINAMTPREVEPPVKNGPVGLGYFTALNLGVAYGPAELVKTLLGAGAKVNTQDARGMTPLMLAVATDRQDPEIIRLLLSHGANVNSKSVTGETAFDWARKMGPADTIDILKHAGAMQGEVHAVPALEPAPTDAKTSVQRSVALLEKTSAQFFRKGGCVACHSQNMTDMVVGLARSKGISIDGKAAAERWMMVKAVYGPTAPMLLERMDPGGAPFSTVYALAGLAATGYAPDRMTDAMLANTLAMQAQDGSWHFGGGVARPPLEEGDFSPTALSIRAIQTYGAPGRAAEMKDRTERAREWLVTAHPITTEDRNMQLLGLHWAGADRKVLRKMANTILAGQRPDGGWSQRPELVSDAYATGQTLVALAQSGGVALGGGAYQKGVKYLLSTQLADGSWYVRSRSPKFQPYFESGFPYRQDQWISMTGTAWATMAVLYSIADTPHSAGR